MTDRTKTMRLAFKQWIWAAVWQRAGCPAACVVVLAALLTGNIAGIAQAQSKFDTRERPTTIKTTFIIDVEITVSGRSTQFSLISIGKLTPQIYPIADPDRLVVDAQDAAFRLPRRLAGRQGGHVNQFRYGLLGPGRARMVLDLARGTEVAAVASRNRHGDIFELNIELIDSWRPTTIAPAAPPPATRPAAPVVEKTPPKKRPIIVIDPGHGGLDPGAVVNRVYLEKAIVLQVARRLSRRLGRSGRYEVTMTRTGDTYLSLDERIERSRAAGASLFISLHADSIQDAAQAKSVAGAAVYILSAQASDAEARQLAEKENAADRLAGIMPPRAAESEGVRNILVDLLSRETQQRSQRFRRLLVAAMRRNVPVSRRPYRSAAFHVLKQTETPAALIELGYMTNPHDMLLMRQKEWQEQMAKAITEAIVDFFRE